MDVDVLNPIPTNVENEHSTIGTENEENFEDGKMLPPPVKSFGSREELLDYVHDFSFTQGYATTIRDSEKEKYVTIGCDRGGTYRNRMNTTFEERIKRSSSRLIDCPFRIKGVKLVDKSWILRVQNGNHNHEASKDMSGHPSFRRCSVEEIRQIKLMCMSGTPPKQILSSLRQANPQFKAISRTIYNVKAKIRKETLRGRAPIDVLFEEFTKGGFKHNVKIDAESRLSSLFFAHPRSVTLSRSYPNVFLMDCTYQTNKYHMPLLDIIGVSSFNTSFYSCFAFLSKEEGGDYVWALNCFKNMLGSDGPTVIVTDRELALMNAIKVVFPNTKNLICSWHIEMNIKKHCKEYFKEEDDWNAFLSWWTSIVLSDSTSVFEESWKEFETVYKDKVVAINYIKKTWLPLREHFVKAWCDAYLHLGNRVTSRAEGSHAVLKSYVQVSTGDLLTTSGKMCLAVENNFREIQTQLASEKITLLHNIRIPFFKELAYRVSKFALQKLLEQYKLAVSNLPLDTCKGQFTATMGLPCAHRMRTMNSDVLHLSEIHSQWRLDNRSFENANIVIDSEPDKLKPLFEELEKSYQEWPITQKIAAQNQLTQIINSSAPIVFDPVVKSRRGRPSKSRATKSLSSTRRLPSSFELAENTRKCTICNQPGHNRRSCSKRDKDVGVEEQIAGATRSPLTSLDPNSMPNNINMVEKPSYIQLQCNAQTSVVRDITKGPSCMTKSTHRQGIWQVKEPYIITPRQQPRNLVPYQYSMHEQMHHHVSQPELYAQGSIYPGNTSSIYGSNTRPTQGSWNSTMQTSSTYMNNGQPSHVYRLETVPQMQSQRLDFMESSMASDYFCDFDH